jgi:hypothetical protein
MQIEAKFFRVGYDGLPQRDWQLVQFFLSPDGKGWIHGEFSLPVPEGITPIWINELLVEDPATGRVEAYPVPDASYAELD